MPRSFEHLVVIGASTGGVHALLAISDALPPSFPAPVCIVQHIGSNPSILPELLRFRGANMALHPEDVQPLTPGTLFVAPPDRHMLVEDGMLRLTHGPRENHARPAIDPLFRSAALNYGPQAIGIVLTGQMDDGTAGLKAIKECGGTAIVQDPATALEPDMPRSALANVPVDYCVALQDIVPLLLTLVKAPAVTRRSPVPQTVAREVAINRGEANMQMLQDIATPSSLTCPDCGGSLWEMKEDKPLRYRCHTGHAFGALSLAQAQKDGSEHALWATVRALREREALLRRMARVSDATGDPAQARAGRAEAERIAAQARSLEDMAETVPPIAQEEPAS
jgi:two-component system, chemotaxis family, protein-glutamate methylesterase/glutaminase